MNETGNKKRFVKNKSLAFSLTVPIRQDDRTLSAAMNRSLVAVTAAGSRYCTTLPLFQYQATLKKLPTSI
jgi:hypothetical protein